MSGVWVGVVKRQKSRARVPGQRRAPVAPKPARGDAEHGEHCPFNPENRRVHGAEIAHYGCTCEWDETGKVPVPL